MTKIAQNITDLIGNTPIVKLNKVVPEDAADVYVKLEFFNPGSSVKDRIALAMIEAAEKAGKIKPGDTLVEPTSGNTGIGLSLVAAAKGYHLIITMPDTMSIERRKLMQGYGTELILTPGANGMGGAIKKATELSNENGYFMPMQFQNPANPEIHEKTTGKEIIDAFGDTPIDGFVAGVGTGGTLSGISHALTKKYPNIKVWALEAAESPLLKEGKTGAHKIQGISAGFIPDTLDETSYSDIIEVTSDQAIKMAQEVSHKEGFLPGISAGANIFGAIEIAKKLGKGKSVVTVAPDNGERYLSTALFD
ncbi:cysteine synthase A [Companilactobacillus alimentarius]|uniref:Cysteine synthase n=1 Tax=Companilactobacillus alimentarius DSM 20249 TaxID=1423720 RepID=A0A2K9HIY7_9LACO|nr:cysteine synthase A [Companilactobacillus alimentarius]AUI71667.1 cysteine synthase A [Companilactobacillus alimentarius DSM 20249]KRK78319.1 cysteine synthase [Companilactobacillus alimentarius DSM 20249]MDT6953342.1 cysteine synthase A [Companilactobacillus alimentarius]GEO44591.1 cysteine synthase [Companilactobacillus alimentarius]